MLQGTNTTFTNYLEDQEGSRYYTDKEKNAKSWKRTWKNIFRITEEEDATIDRQHPEQIEAYVNIHTQIVSPYIKSDLARLNNTNFYTRPMSTEEIKKYLNRTKNKAPGSFKISKKGYRKTHLKCCYYVNYKIFNSCFLSGYFPIAFKKGIIKFIPEVNNPLRPITLCEAPGKLFEKIRQTECISDRQQYYKERQHGFRQNKCATMAIATTYETIANALTDKQQAIAVLRDVAKAYDKVRHSGTKDKLLLLHLPSVLEKVLCYFLDNRTSKISTGNEYSNEIGVLSGVPQGSVISPSVYTPYLNDLSQQEWDALIHYTLTT